MPASLDGSGFEAIEATDMVTALEAARSAQACIAVVDALFSGDGMDFCERLWSEKPGFPVVLTGPNDEELVTRALTRGADDYLVLPLRSAELIARLRAVLRRAPRAGDPRASQRAVLQAGEVRLDPDRHEVTVRSVPVHLPLREFSLLRVLMENAGIVLSRSVLLARLWGPSVPLDSTSLEVHIRRLRAKLEDDPANPRRIVTVRGVGYRYQAGR